MLRPFFFARFMIPSDFSFRAAPPRSLKPPPLPVRFAHEGEAGP